MRTSQTCGWLSWSLGIFRQVAPTKSVSAILLDVWCDTVVDFTKTAQPLAETDDMAVNWEISGWSQRTAQDVLLA